jgi:hypothetical protein
MKSIIRAIFKKFNIESEIDPIIPFIPLKSKIDPGIDFDKDHVVISLVRHDDHAIIILESVGVSNNHEMFKIDFVRKGEDSDCCRWYGADPGQVLFDTTYEGDVRKFSVNLETKTIAESTRDDIFKKLKLEDKSQSWVFLRSLVNDMIDSIENERRNPPRFNIKGKFKGKGVAHNCCSWAVEKLSMVPLILAPAENYLRKGHIATYLRI